MTKIITDAGIETVDYLDALKYFTTEEIRSYWLEVTEMGLRLTF